MEDLKFVFKTKTIKYNLHLRVLSVNGRNYTCALLCSLLRQKAPNPSAKVGCACDILDMSSFEGWNFHLKQLP
jgi:hypothetical protein